VFKDYKQRWKLNVNTQHFRAGNIPIDQGKTPLHIKCKTPLCGLAVRHIFVHYFLFQNDRFNTNTSITKKYKNMKFLVDSFGIRDIKLPPLPLADIEKLDYLLAVMKKNQTEFVNIHLICKKKWGDNKLLYLFFAEYLKINGFALVEDYTKGEKYVWRQMIAPRGLALDSFKNEYRRQRKQKMQESRTQPKRLLNNSAGIAPSILLTAFLIISLLFSTQLVYTNANAGMLMKQRHSDQDSLTENIKKIMESNTAF
jgi:hypothetical protein